MTDSPSKNSAADQVIDYRDFTKIDIRVGTVIRAEPFPEARKPALKLTINFGETLGLRKTSAQITKYYDVETIIGKQIAAVVNFPPKQIGPFISEVLVLGFPDENGNVVLIALDHKVPNGGKLF